MKNERTFRSDIQEAVYEAAEGLFAAGIIDKKTMREFDELALTPVEPLTPEEIKAIRERELVSQTVFALYLNVTKSLVSQWERGEKKPAGPSLKLLTLVNKKGLSAIQ